MDINDINANVAAEINLSYEYLNDQLRIIDQVSSITPDLPQLIIDAWVSYMLKVAEDSMITNDMILEALVFGKEQNYDYSKEFTEALYEIADLYDDDII